MFRSFAHYNFRLWIAGLLISNLGVWMQRTAQDWIVLTELTDQNATAVGLTTALQFAPQLLLAGVTGTIADRFDRRLTLAVTQSVMALLAIVLTVLAFAGVLEMWMMYALALGVGVANAFDIPARQAFVAQIVPREDLTNAISLNGATFNGARLIGPGLAGLLLGVTSSGWVFALNAASFVAVLVSIAALRMGEVSFVDRSAAAGSGYFREGLRYMRGRPDLILVTVVMFIFGVLGFNLPVITATMTSIEFHEGPEVFGIMGSAVAVGSITGSLLIARMSTIRLHHLALAGLGSCLAYLFAAIAPNIWTFGIALAVIGLAMLMLTSGANAFVQTSTPPEYLGRVISIYVAFFIGATPIGSPLAGWVADVFGPRWTVLLSAAAGFLVATIITVWLIVVRKARLGWNPDRRWRLQLRFARSLAADPVIAAEDAKVEAAAAEAQAQAQAGAEEQEGPLRPRA